MTTGVEVERERSAALQNVLTVFSHCQIGWILVRRRVTRRLTKIQSIGKLWFYACHSVYTGIFLITGSGSAAPPLAMIFNLIIFSSVLNCFFHMHVLFVLVHMFIKAKSI
jgi:hypothetical protein